jgi:hypothetical protein
MKRLSLIALLLLLAAGPAYAGPPVPDNGLVAPDQAAALAVMGPQTAVPIGGLWQEFKFTGVGAPAGACDGTCLVSSGENSEYVGVPPWTFTAPCDGVHFTVTDAFSSGDVFEVFDFGVSLGTTSAPATGHDGGSDPAISLLDSAMSSRVFDLAPGDHSITITPTASPSSGGAAYFRIDRINPNDDDCDGILNSDDLCANTSIPEDVPTVELGVNRWALVDEDGNFDTRLPAGKGHKRSYSISDTAGCSCEQIIAEMGLGAGHTKFGCSISAMNDWIHWIHCDTCAAPPSPS